MTRASRPKPTVLCILDGFGERSDRSANAIRLARMPALDALHARYASTLLSASGRDVGLPDGQMGNSEVGHMNFGAGRVAQMDLSRIDVAVSDGTLEQNATLSALLETAKRSGGRLHLLGLCSDGGVHSSLEHVDGLLAMAARRGVPAVLHAFLDGRDTPPQSAGKYLAHVAQSLAGKGVLGTVGGRFYAMDRDQRWERVARAFDAIVHARGARRDDWQSALGASYDAGVTDEFVEPTVLGDYAGLDPQGRDVALFFNFRPDRARELTLALTAPECSFFDRGEPRHFASYVCMTQYDAKLPLPVAFPKVHYPELFPELLARAGLGQFRCAETEKYAHVTYFFNGGREEPYAGEERKLVPSPKSVKTYDLKPEMSAPEVTLAVTEAVRSGRYDFILVNYANPDMVGHTGILPAAIAAVEAVDVGLAALSRAVLEAGGALLVTADHGNCELMVDPVTGAPHTAHTTNPVPFVYVQEGREADRVSLRSGGRLCDVAPTMLELLGLEQPEAMTGRSLFETRHT